MARSCVLVYDASLRSGKHGLCFGTSSSKAFPEAYTFREVHGEQRGMGYGLHLPRTSQVGNQNIVILKGLNGIYLSTFPILSYTLFN
ncbi:hypothetical protein K1719_034816 [Acacia pycnantha]|nr:hypothetical protein K1719_034816 [Acacia pycnantha]